MFSSSPLLAILEVLVWLCVVVLIIQFTRLYRRHQIRRDIAEQTRLNSWAAILRAFNQQDGKVSAVSPWRPSGAHRSGKPVALLLGLQYSAAAGRYLPTGGAHSVPVRHLRVV